MKFAFISEEKVAFPVAVLCRVLAVSPSGYYASCRAPSLARAAATRSCPSAWRRPPGQQAAVRQPARARRSQGGRRARRAQARGEADARKAPRGTHKRRFRATTDSKHGFPIAPNVLERDFTAAAPNQAWVTDITYIWTTRGLAVPRGDPRPVLAARGGLGDQRERRPAPRARSAGHGARATPPGRGPRAPLRSRQHVRERRVPQGARDQRHRVQHEPQGRLLGQRRRRELLRIAEARTGGNRRPREPGWSHAL